MSDCRLTNDLDQYEHEQFMSDLGLDTPDLDADSLRDMHNEFDAETDLDTPMLYAELGSGDAK